LDVARRKWSTEMRVVFISFPSWRDRAERRPGHFISFNNNSISSTTHAGRKKLRL
jgi:hypothetical protein